MCSKSNSFVAVLALIVIMLTIKNEVHGAVFSQRAYIHPGKFLFQYFIVDL